VKKHILKIGLAFMMALALAAGALADEAKPADTATAKPAGTTLEDIKNLLGMSIYLQGGYTYNFVNPDSQENRLRVFDHEANSFTLDLAQLVFTKDAPVGGVGFKLKLSAGETAKFIHSLGLGISSGEDPNDSDAFDLTEAYIDYVAPLGKGLKFRFGKFVTYNGAEVIEAKDNMNYSRGLLFNYAIPFAHTGLMVGYPFSDAVSANFYLVNGWDDFDDNNTGKTVGLNLNITPVEQFSMAFNFTYGPEKDDNNSDNRFLFDWIGTLKPVKNLTFVLNTDYATEQHSAPDGGSAKWYGIAGYAKYDFSDLFSAAVRAEYFQDPDGVRTGLDQTVKEITLTPEFRVAKNLIIRPEYRHDWSDKEAFDSHHHSLDKKSQDTIALGVMYTW
jgi:hypothetical protein